MQRIWRPGWARIMRSKQDNAQWFQQPSGDLREPICQESKEIGVLFGPESLPGLAR